MWSFSLLLIFRGCHRGENIVKPYSLVICKMISWNKHILLVYHSFHIRHSKPCFCYNKNLVWNHIRWRNTIPFAQLLLFHILPFSIPRRVLRKDISVLVFSKQQFCYCGGLIYLTVMLSGNWWMWRKENLTASHTSHSPSSRRKRDVAAGGTRLNKHRLPAKG